MTSVQDVSPADGTRALNGSKDVKSRRRRGIRRDLQGIRGLGIIFVVVGHLWRWPPGVYAMLDMFFVLSGFLITGLLLDSIKKYGGISFAQFYLSRLRRLMPMATLVIVVTIAGYSYFFNAARGLEAGRDGIWALLLVVNWHFYINSTNYFSDSNSSPLLHYWSLSIEEQFYMVWPLLLVVVMLIAAQRRLNRQVVIFTVLGVLTGVSFAYSMWHSASAPGQAYFSTFDRVWEFGIGGLLAAARPYWARMSQRLGGAMGWVGSVGLLFAICIPTYGLAFPAPWALPVIALTALVIAGGHGRSTTHLRHLDNRVMVYLGDISYSIYLWHLPVNLLLKPYFTGSDPRFYILAIGITMSLSVTSYHLVERPLRHARMLMTKREKRMFPKRLRTRRVQLGLAFWLGSIAMALVVLVVTQQAPGSQPNYLAAGQGPAVQGGLTNREDVVAQQQKRLTAALGRDRFPAFNPPLDQLDPAHWYKGLQRTGCVEVPVNDVESCRFGPANATKLAVVVGDSIAMSWIPGIRQALGSRGWQVQQLTLALCPAWTFPSYVDNHGVPFENCAAHHRLVERFVARTKPALLILSSGLEQAANAGLRGLPSDVSQLAHQGLLRTLKTLSPAAGRTVVLSPIPPLKSLRECVTRLGGPEDCISSPSSSLGDVIDGESDAAAQAGVNYVNTEDWFCVADSCPAFVGRTPVTVEGIHLTVEYAQALAPLLAHALLKAN